MKKIVNLVLILFTIIFIGNVSFATEIETKQKDVQEQSILKIADVKEDLGNLNSYIGGNNTDISKIADKSGVILGIIQVIGTVISVIALIIIGIKYMLGSLEQRAEYKKTMLTYIIGVILVFAVTFLPGFIYNFTQETINKEAKTVNEIIIT